MENALDKQGFVPLYHQIQQSILGRISSGELKQGDLLESEEELGRRYKVSRMTARQALQGLKARGYAVSERGRGTFVTVPKLSKSILVLDGFTDEFRKRGITPSSRLLHQVVRMPDEIVAERLNIAPNSPTLYLRRLRLADGVPIAIEDSHVPIERFPGIADIDLSGTSLYQTMHDQFQTQFGWADEVIEAVPATPSEARLLTVPKRSSVLCISRTLFGRDGSTLEFAISRYRGDRYRASLRVGLSSQE